MNRDLEAQLQEMGPDYRAVVDRLVGAYRPYGETCEATAAVSEDSRRGRILGWSAAYLVAASLLVCLGLAFCFRGNRAEPKVYAVRVSDARLAYTLAYANGETSVRNLLESQRADGSWSNDFQTRQNAAALRGNPAAAVAYKKAVRYLRAKGLVPLSDEELKARSRKFASQAAAAYLNT